MSTRKRIALNFVALSMLCTSPAPALTNATLAAESNVLHKYVVRIDRDGQLHCSGVLIAPHTILTAAHCVVDDDHERIRDLSIVFYNNGRKIRRPVVNSVFSAQFEARDQAYGDSDIGLMFFSGSVPQGYEPAKVLTNSNGIPDERVVVLAGYGATEIADQGDPSGDGAGPLRTSVSAIIKADYSQTEFSIGLGDNFQRATCEGDSGGPVFIIGENGERIVAGVISSDITNWSRKRKKHPRCAIKSSITKVTAFTKWIPENIQKFQPRK